MEVTAQGIARRFPPKWLAESGDVLGRTFAVVILIRLLLALKMVVVTLTEIESARRPWLVVLSATLLVAWTFFISWWLRSPRHRRLRLHVTDAAVTLGLLLLTPLALNPSESPLALTGHWIAGCGLYAAVLRSTRSGLVISGLTGVVYLLMAPGSTMQRIDVVLVSVLSAFTLGILMGQFKATIAERERERVRTVALSERERLARIVHDGALQVLALVEREGPSLGPRGIRLAALARESESQLRTLLRDREVTREEEDVLVDLAAALDKYQSAQVTVSTMAGEVMVPRAVVDEVEATLVEALKNVERHAGQEAKAWLLLDQETDDEVILWIRDNGVGMTAEQLSSAADRGRMGIQGSIVGRMASLGGSAMLRSSPGMGTEWELRFPVKMGEQ